MDLLCVFPPKHFFCVSTDKAANPVNIMGASKRIMEDLVMAYNEHFKVTTARFANVAFSNGSLPDGWIHRLQKKQPLAAPSDVKRYFVSPEESGHGFSDEFANLFIVSRNRGDCFYIFIGLNWFRDGKKLISDSFASLFDTIADEDWVCASIHRINSFMNDGLGENGRR